MFDHVSIRVSDRAVSEAFYGSFRHGLPTSLRSRDGHDCTGRSSPSPADHESPITTTRSPEPVTCPARAFEAAANCWHFERFALACVARTPEATRAATSASTAVITTRRRGRRTRESTSASVRSARPRTHGPTGSFRDHSGCPPEALDD